MMAGPEIHALNEQAALGEVVMPERSQFAHLLRHFLERFFSSEATRPGGDTKARLVQIAFATGLPPMIVAMYLWPVYHPYIVFRRERAFDLPPVPYWLQVNHHFFFVVYSLVALGLAAVFEWDLFFPDLLDLFVLKTLPVDSRRLFAARVSAIAILIGGFLLDANLLAPIVLPLATDPKDLTRFVVGQVGSTLCAGLFAGALVLAVQSTLLGVLGERLFRRISLALQGAAVVMLVMLLLLFPVLSGATPALLQSGSGWVLWFPPFWFLGIYERALGGANALPVFGELAQIGVMATGAAVALTAVAYPVAYLRRTRALIEGPPKGAMRFRPWRALNMVLDVTTLRKPVKRAVFHFIGQTLARIPRFRIYLVMYGGVGLSIVLAMLLRLQVVGGHVEFRIAIQGAGAVIGVVAFWVIAGLRTTLGSAENWQQLWIWRVVQGNPPAFESAVERAEATRMWAVMAGLGAALLTQGLLYLFTAPSQRSLASLEAQFVVAVGACVLLSDGLFLRTTRVPFSGGPEVEGENPGLTVLRFVTLFPLVVALAAGLEGVMEFGPKQLGIVSALIVVAHLWLRKKNREHLRLFSEQLEMDEGEEEIPGRLGLRS